MRIILSFLLFMASSVVSAQQFTPTQYILYKSGAASISTQALNAWLPPGVAYTAVTIPMPLLKWKNAGLTVLHAESQMVWKPRSPGGNTGVAALLCPPQSNAGSGLVGCTFLSWFAANNTALADYTPGCFWNNGNVMPCRADITAILQSAISQATSNDRFLALATYGNGSNGPDVYDVEIFIDWGHQ